jgi:hypothetical protein
VELALGFLSWSSRSRLAWSSRSRLALLGARAVASPGSRARVGARVLSQPPLSSPGARARVPLAAATVEVRLCLSSHPPALPLPSPLPAPLPAPNTGPVDRLPHPLAVTGLFFSVSRTRISLSDARCTCSWYYQVTRFSISLALLLAKRSSFDLCGTIRNEF